MLKTANVRQPSQIEHGTGHRRADPARDVLGETVDVLGGRDERLARCGSAFDSFVVRRARRDVLDDRGAREVAGRVPAHPVGDGEDRRLARSRCPRSRAGEVPTSLTAAQRERSHCSPGTDRAELPGSAELSLPRRVMSACPRPSSGRSISSTLPSPMSIRVPGETTIDSPPISTRPREPGTCTIVPFVERRSVSDDSTHRPRAARGASPTSRRRGDGRASELRHAARSDPGRAGPSAEVDGARREPTISPAAHPDAVVREQGPGPSGRARPDGAASRLRLEDDGVLEVFPTQAATGRRRDGRHGRCRPPGPSPAPRCSFCRARARGRPPEGVACY